ncbi:MAG: 16S rRNA (cytidine(1402)-2'-O)-methyltransferase [Magnetococcus sp. MYC-9]
MSVGKVYIVPTPIGNLEDMTFRAVRVLQSVTRILAEDTRHTRILCAHYGIQTPMTSFNDHNAAQRVPEILRALRQGAEMALVTDAGTPGISDPGLPLIRAVVAESIALEVLPGASAVMTALSGSGFPLDRFIFEGFLPRKGRQRAERLAQIAAEERTVVLFESPVRLHATLTDLQKVGCEQRPALVARELTKLFETWHRGSVIELAEWFQTHPARGEMVLLLHGRESAATSPEVAEALLENILAEGGGMKAATQRMAQLTGLSRAQLYKMALAKKNACMEEDAAKSGSPVPPMPDRTER